LATAGEPLVQPPPQKGDETLAGENQFKQNAEEACCHCKNEKEGVEDCVFVYSEEFVEWRSLSMLSDLPPCIRLRIVWCAWKPDFANAHNRAVLGEPAGLIYQ